MPYKNLPKSKWDEMEKCIADVRAGGGVDNPYAVCYASIMGKAKNKKRDIIKKHLMK